MTYPYIPARLHGGAQSKISRIVIHATVSPCAKGGARQVARYFQSPGAGGSAHYIVDPLEIVQCVKDDVVAYHAPPNTGTLGVELCDWQKGDPDRWGDTDHTLMLVLAARLVRELAAKHDVPLKLLTVSDVKEGKRGICSHVSVSKAFGKSDHGDPDIAGPFPWAKFMQLITKKENAVSGPDVWNHKIPSGPQFEGEWAAGTHLRYQSAELGELADRVKRAEVQNAEILALVKETNERLQALLKERMAEAEKTQG